jgi:hypothetical protein
MDHPPGAGLRGEPFKALKVVPSRVRDHDGRQLPGKIFWLVPVYGDDLIRSSQGAKCPCK